MADQKVNINITASDMASGSLENIRRNMKQIGDDSNIVAARMKAMGGAIVAAFGSVQLAGLIKESTMLAARVETLGTVMKVIGNNAGYSGAQMTAFENQVKAMGITTQEARNNLTRMASSQMDLTKASDLARIAQDAGRIGNINSSEAFARLIQGVRSGEVEVLRNIGINVMFEEGYKKTAATLGTTSEKLSVAEKMTSRMNQVIEFGKNINGAYEASLTTVGGQMSSLARQTEEIKLAFGEAFKPALLVAMTEVNRSLKEMNAGMSANKDGIKTFGEDLAGMTAGSLAYVKKDLLNISALILDIKASGYRLGSWAAIPGMVAGSETYDGLVKTANGYTAAAKAQRDYVEAMKAVAASGTDDPSDQKNLAMARAAQEQRRIASAAAARAAAGGGSGGAAGADKYNAFTNDHYKLLIKGADEYNKKIEEQEKSFYDLGQEIERTAQASASVFNINSMTTGGDLSTGNRYKVQPLSSIRLNSMTQYSGSQSAPDLSLLEKENKEKLKLEQDFQKSMMDVKLDAASSAAGLLRSVAGENKAIQIAAMVAEKAIAIARIMINTEVAASAAIASAAMLGPAGAAIGITNAAAIRAMSYVSIGMVAASGAIEGMNIAGQRALGGPVSGGASYLVGERGPEIFTPGASGNITPNNALGGKSVVINQAFSITGVSADIMQNTKAIAKQAADAAKNEILNSMNRGGEFALASGRMR